MPDQNAYTPGPAYDAEAVKEGTRWTLAMVRTFKHPPERVWEAITDPEHLREWAPFDASGSLATTGATVSLTTVGAPAAQVDEITVARAEPPRVLEYEWGAHPMRWELEPFQGGTRLKLWTSIPKNYIAMGAAGWHICFDVMGRLLDGAPVGRRVGMGLMSDEGWNRLHAEYAKRFGIEMPKW